MGEYLARDPDGAAFLFDIEGNVPTPSEAARIDAYFKNGPPKPVAAASTPKEEEEPGIIESLGSGLARGWNKTQAAGDFAMQSLHEGLGNTEKAKEWDEAARAQIAEGESYKARSRSFTDEPTVSGKIANLAGTMGESLVGQLPGIAGAVAGAPGGPAGIIAGYGLGSAVGSVPQLLTANAERQIEQHGFVKDWDKAYAATGAGALLEGLTATALGRIAGIGGIAAKSVLTAPVRRGVETGIKKAMTTAAGRIGAAGAFNAVSGALEETLQQGAERWQADMALMDDAAKEEYIESAVVGGILEGLFGAGAGYVGHRQSTKAQKAEQDALKDVEAERAIASSKMEQNYPAHQRLRDAKYEDPPPPPPPALTKEQEKAEQDKRLRLPDYSAATREQVALEKEETKLPPGLQGDLEPDVLPDLPASFPAFEGPRKVGNKSFRKALLEYGKAPNRQEAINIFRQTSEAERATAKRVEEPPMQGPVKPTYSEPEYRDTLDKLRPFKSISVDRIVKEMKMPRPKAQQVFNEMLRRNDAYPSGPQNQYARITVPHGIKTREGSNARGEFDPRQSRDFIVKPVRPANQRPFTIEVNGKKKGAAFQTRSEAEAWVAANVPESKRKNVNVAEDTSGQQFGIYQQTYRHGKDNNETLVGEQVVDTYATRQEADEAIKGYDPAYSPQTNRQKKEMPVEAREAAAADGLLRELGGMESKLQKVLNRTVGEGRARVDLVPALTRAVLKKIFPNTPDADIPGEDAMVEGVTTPQTKDLKDVVRNVITLGADINSPTLTEDERLKLIEEVLNHELIHLIRNLDLLTAKEWNQLYDTALHSKIPGKTYTWVHRSAAMHRGANTNKIMEEAIAEMFRAYVKDPTSFRSETRGILKKLADFVKKLVGLGKRYDANDLMDMITQGGIADREIGAGGLGARPGHPEDVFYSLLKPDNFYLKSRQTIEMSKWPRAEAHQWRAAIKNAGIKREEMDWLQLDEWLQDQSKNVDAEGNPVPVEKKDILNYIDANGIGMEVRTSAQSGDLADKFEGGPTSWQRLQTPGGTDYSEARFIFRPREGHPKYETGHWPDDINVLAHVRFKTVMEGDKKILFIEEIQSDLHSDARKAGGYWSGTLRRAVDEANVAYGEALQTELALEKRIKDIDAMAMREYAQTKRVNPLHQRALDNMREAFGRARVATKEKKVVFDNLRERLFIPEAPLKTNWEEYVIKRMLRHAAEHEFDAVSWHGSPESVAHTEKYSLTKEDVETGPKYFADPQKKRNVTSVINRYVEKLPRIVNKIVQRFGGAVTTHEATAGIDPTQRQATGIYDRSFADEYQIDDYFDSRPKVAALLAKLRRKFKTDRTIMADDEYEAGGLVELVATANQAVINQRNFNPVQAFQRAGMTPEDIETAVFWADAPGGWAEVKRRRAKPKGIAGHPYKNYRIDLNSAMSEAFRRGDIPMFSTIGPPMYAANAPMGQRVPAAPPTSVLQDIHNKVLYNNLAPVLQRVLGYVPGTGAKTQEAVEDTFIKLQDRMLPIGKLIDRMKKNGGFITNENDTYLREMLFSGQTDAQLVNAERDFYKPFKDAIKATGVVKADVDDAIRTFGVGSNVEKILNRYSDPRHALTELYAYAQHAQERNREMRSRNDPVQAARPLAHQAGSGLGDLEAQQILDWFSSKPFGRKFNDETNPNSVRSRIRDIITHTNDIRVAGGLNPDFRTMTMTNGKPANPYKDYVPIRGIMRDGLVDDNEARNFARTGQGFNIRGKEDFAAIGRETSLGHDILANLIIQNQEAIVRANKNKVGLSFRQLILDNTAEMEGVAEIIPTPKTEYGFDRKRGVVRQKNVDYKLLSDPSVLKVKDKGQQVFIKIHDKRVQKAMNPEHGLGNTGLDSLIEGMLWFNRWMAAMRTSYSPEFIINNFARDFEAAMINLTEAEEKGIRRKVASAVIPAIRGIRRVVRKEDLSSDWAKAYEEFKLMGGQTAFYGIHELEDTMKRINDEFREDASGGPGVAKKQFNRLTKFVSDYNLVIENGSRLAAYKTLRDEYLARSGTPNDPATQKMAKEMAARAAKNLTVNFNMGGEGKTFINALYLFFNASLQGAMALINPLIRSRRMKMIWGGVLLAGMIQDMMMSALSEEDDDGKKKYDKIQPHILEHNLVFIDPFGISERGYLKIPMPYLMNGIYNFGRMTSKTLRGEATLGEMMSSGGGTILASLNPFGSSNSLLNFVAPTIFDPIVDLAQNEDFTGKPIAPALSPYSDVHENRSQQYWNNTFPLYITIADMMSRLTGRKGDYLPGVVEVSPNQIGYGVDWLFGSAGKFVAQSANLGWKGVAGDLEDITVQDIPFVRKVVGSVTERNDMEAFIEGRDQVLRIKKALADADKEGDRNLYMQIMRDYPREYKLAARINALENARKKESTRVRKIRDSKNLSDEKKKELIKKARDRQNMLVGKGNALLEAAGIE